jgi:putative spermidine/putrescine transport system permease protein
VTTRATPARTALAPILLAGLLLGLPLLAGVGYLVLGAAGAMGGSAPARVGAVLRDTQVWASVGLSLWIAVAGTVLALIGALAVVLLFAGRTPLDRLTRSVALLPLPVPTLAAAVAMLLLLSQSGWLSRVSHAIGVTAQPSDFPALVFDPMAVGVIAAIVWKELPFLALVGFSLHSLRGGALADTARTLGATPWQVTRRVTLPLLLRGLAPSAIAVGVFVFGSLELPLVLGPSDPLALPMLLQERRQSLDGALRGDAYLIALLTTVIALCAVALHEWLRDGDAP